MVSLDPDCPGQRWNPTPENTLPFIENVWRLRERSDSEEPGQSLLKKGFIRGDSAFKRLTFRINQTVLTVTAM
ncbi:MAG: hypothetical protein ACYCYP_10490 [Leptospirales bacterium]